jgi:hypothetical protein
LTGWGAEAVPEPGEKHELVKGKASASCVMGNAVRPIGVGARLTEQASKTNGKLIQKPSDSLLTLQPIGGRISW